MGSRGSSSGRFVPSTREEITLTPAARGDIARDPADMPLSRRAVLGAGAASAVALLAGCTGDWGINGTKVLFIGNSFTDFNGGLDGMLKQLAPRTEAERISPGGSNLQQHSVSDEDASSLKTGGGGNTSSCKTRASSPCWSRNSSW